MKRIIVFIALIVLLVTVSIRATETNDADAASIKSINDEQEGSDKYISNKNKQEQYLRKSSIQARRKVQCELGPCYGNEGDSCNYDSDCQPGLDCDWTDWKRICKKKEEEGEVCWRDDECKGYCEMGKCYDGSEGDRCIKDSDCQSGLDCDWQDGKLLCKKKKSEGQFCWVDSECAGYCHELKCRDGSKGDLCGNDRDCQSEKCQCRGWFCFRKRCL